MAFYHNQLTSVTIPIGVTSIDAGAFLRNPLNSVNIGSNIEMGGFDGPTFSYDFDNFYMENKKKGGTYVYRNEQWIW
jgi:hypothetical protein